MRPIPTLCLLAFAISLPSAALAQATPAPHQHGQAQTTAPPPQAAPQHRAPGLAVEATAPQPGHPAGCECPCCEMMRQMMEMMRQHQGQAGMMPSMQHETPAPQPPADQHQHDTSQPH